MPTLTHDDNYHTAIQNITWPAPAKLNLFLHIVGKISSGPFAGYHELQSVFQLLDYGDALSFQRSAGQDIDVASAEFSPPIEQNLVYRAASLLKNFATQQNLTTTGVRIQLHKCLPVGGGVGGGSSNAATTLVILNELWNLHFAQDTLCTLALSLGADVPVFVRGSSAFVEGIGEKITPIALPDTWYVVLTPPVPINTSYIFAHPSLTRDTTKVKIADLHLVAEFGHNDCQTIVSQNYPEVHFALEWLGQFGVSRLTGTGSSVFVVCDSQQQAKEIFDKIAYPAIPKGYKGFYAQGVATSPLFLRLHQLKSIFGV